jgi:nucleoside-diphosphate-sugar epimerase
VRFATGKLKPSPGIHVSVVKFHEALRDKGESPPVPAEEGRRVIALLEDVSRRADDDKRAYLAEPNQSLRPRILVTGANGFLGQALVKRLRQEMREPLRCWCAGRRRSLPPDDLQLVYGDLGNPAVVDRAMEGIEIVFHVGAATKGGPFEFESGTIWGTRNVIDACERHGVRRLVYVSSMSVLDHAGHRAGVPVNESSPYEPFPQQRGLYTQTKLEAEKMVLAAAAAGRMRAVVLRPGQIYGPGAEKFPPSGTIGIAGRWLVVGSGNHHVPLVYIDNVVDALMLAATRDLSERLHFPVGRSPGADATRVCRLRPPGRPPGARVVCARMVSQAGRVWRGVARKGAEAPGAAHALPRAVHHASVALRLHSGAYHSGLAAAHQHPGRHAADFPAPVGSVHLRKSFSERTGSGVRSRWRRRRWKRRSVGRVYIPR